MTSAEYGVQICAENILMITKYADFINKYNTLENTRQATVQNFKISKTVESGRGLKPVIHSRISQTTAAKYKFYIIFGAMS